MIQTIVFMSHERGLNLDIEPNVIIRPSGTEPKMKIYLQAKGKDFAEAQVKNDKTLAFINAFING